MWHRQRETQDRKARRTRTSRNRANPQITPRTSDKWSKACDMKCAAIRRSLVHRGSAATFVEEAAFSARVPIVSGTLVPELGETAEHTRPQVLCRPPWVGGFCVGERGYHTLHYSLLLDCVGTTTPTPCTCTCIRAIYTSPLLTICPLTLWRGSCTRTLFLMVFRSWWRSPAGAAAWA